MRSKKRGFTLIELLVVVAIIALLIAILLPAIGKAKIVAQRSACAANVKAMNLALTFYRTENNNNNPLYTPCPGFFAATSPWDHEYFYTVQLAPYLNVITYTNKPKNTGANGQMYAFMSAIYGDFPNAFSSKKYSVTNLKRRSALFCPANIVTELNYGWNSGIPLFFPTSDYAPVQVTWARGVNGSDDKANPMITNNWNSLFTAAGAPLNTNSGTFFTGLKMMQGSRSDATIATFGQFNSSASGPYGVYVSNPDANPGPPVGYVGYCWGYSSTTVINGQTTTPSMAHGDILPFGFLDGHAEMISKSDIKNQAKYGHSGAGAPYGQVPLWSPYGG